MKMFVKQDNELTTHEQPNRQLRRLCYFVCCCGISIPQMKIQFGRELHLNIPLLVCIFSGKIVQLLPAIPNLITKMLQTALFISFWFYAGQDSARNLNSNTSKNEFLRINISK